MQSYGLSAERDAGGAERNCQRVEGTDGVSASSRSGHGEVPSCRPTRTLQNQWKPSLMLPRLKNRKDTRETERTSFDERRLIPVVEENGKRSSQVTSIS